MAAVVQNKSKTLVLRMEALGSLSGQEWLHGEVSNNHTLGLKLVYAERELFCSMYSLYLGPKMWSHELKRVSKKLSLLQKCKARR